MTQPRGQTEHPCAPCVPPLFCPDRRAENEKRSSQQGAARDVIPLKLQGSGAIQPVTRLASQAIDTKLEQPSGWTERHFAIASRAVAGPEETSSAMGAAAAWQALDAAGWQAGEIDVLVGACGVMEQPIPGTACL